MRSFQAPSGLLSYERRAALRRWLVAFFLLVAPGLALFSTLAEAHPGHHLAVPAWHPPDVAAPLAIASQRGEVQPSAAASPHCPGESGGCGCHLDGCLGQHEARVLVAGGGSFTRFCPRLVADVVPIAPESPRPQSVALALKRARAPPLP